mgnify:FL=1
MNVSKGIACNNYCVIHLSKKKLYKNYFKFYGIDLLSQQWTIKHALLLWIFINYQFKNQSLLHLCTLYNATTFISLTIKSNPKPKPMNNIYLRISQGLILLTLQLISYKTLKAQCPVGYPSGQVAYDTTIATPPGINTLFVKFPQADPYDGLLTCLRICISITGVVDSVSVENNSASAQTADIYYIRTDQITGPGLIAPLTNSINHHYGSYALGPSTAPLGAGPDFVAISKDTLLNAVTTCATITNSDSLFQFYGHDSVTYQYNITAFTNISCTGGNYNSTVATSALVRFRFEYCTCTGLILPLNITNFRIDKQTDNKASLVWSEMQEPESPDYHYEVEMSRDGIHFTNQGRVEGSNEINVSYKFPFTAMQQGEGVYYFRIRQVYASGYSRFSDIRTVTLKNSQSTNFILFPNPSNGIIGIKFDNIQDEKKIIDVSGSFYQLATSLQKGMYWVRVTDVTSHLYSVNQLFIK